ncbi:helix-turn-helix domain-containing protein [Ruegeria atlantica]|uniref:helix-turn-helix domain-containing protein n=1 Tax=Ruegeria atlantica TaxID=81569 RepID=UPI00071CC293|nr:helix-turn-helix transcriptional regulator [Ruegeria atlantica]
MKSLRTREHQILIAGLKEARLKAGLTQAALAERLGTVQSFVAKSETGERRMDVVEFARWAEATTGIEAFTEILTEMVKP